MVVQLENGKYIYRQDEEGSEVLRYGVPWRDVTGDKLIYCMAAEIERLRAELMELKAQDTQELQLLRNVFEAARRYMRFAGVDNEKAIGAYAQLDAAIERVNLFDAGQLDA